MSELLTWYFWFEKRTPVTPRTMWVAFFLFMVLLIGGIILAILGRTLKRLPPLQRRRLRHFSSPCITAGILGELLLFFHFEHAPFLALRFWFLFLGVGIAVWTIVRARRAFILWPRMARTTTVDTKTRYLPKTNR